jgi:hypothetical protein
LALTMELFIVGGAVYLLWRWINGSARAGTGSGALVGPVPWSRDGTDVRLVRALARADGRRLLRHPAFVGGVVLTPLTGLAAAQTETTWGSISGSLALALVPLGWLTIVATDLVALRPRRTGADELFAALPAPQAARTGGLLVAGIGPVLVATALVIGGVLMVDITRGDELAGTLQWAETAAGILLVAGSVCVGVAVARWFPSAGFGVLAVLATILIQVRFLDVTTWPWDRSAGDPMRFLAFLAPWAPNGDDVLEVRPAGWHVVYLGALVLVVACVALLRDGGRRLLGGAVTAAVLVAASAGWMQTRPLSDAREDHMVSYLTEPADHQVCETTGRTQVCAYPGFAGRLSGWSERIESVLSVLPPDALDGRGHLMATQRAPIIVGNEDCSPVPFEDGLPPTVAQRLTPERLWPADGHVHPGYREETFPCSERSTNGLALSVQTAAWAVGLPPAPHHRNVRCTANGQARAAVAIWAAASAQADGGGTIRRVLDAGTIGTTLGFDGWDNPPMWGVRYAVADIALALDMLELRREEVTAVLADSWDRWIDPTTPSTALARALGISIGESGPPPGADPCP